MADGTKQGVVNPRRFEAMWGDYVKKVLPKNASRLQVQETRRAFYAGGISLFYGVLTMFAEDDVVEPTAEDLRKMDELKAEFDAWARDLAEGRA